MIKSLKIENLAVIKKIALEFSDGLNILTGETGAGKSIIVDSIKLLFGIKKGKEFVRSGEKKAIIEAEFTLKNYEGILNEYVDEDDEEIVIRREIYATGKTKSFINGVMVNSSLLKELSEDFITIYGQKDNSFLTNKDNHRKYIDQFIDKKILEKVKSLSEKIKKAKEKLNELEEMEKKRNLREEFLKHSIGEIEKAFLEEEEERELREKREVFKNSTEIIESLSQISKLLSSEDFSLIDVILKIKENLRTLSKYKREWEKDYELFESLQLSIEDMETRIESFLSDFDFSPEEADLLEEKLKLWEDLKRKYGNDRERILEFLEESKKELEKINSLEISKIELQRELKIYTDEYEKLSEKLSNERRKVAEEVQKRISHIMKSLGIKYPQFVVEISKKEDEFSPDGIDNIRFLFSANKGEEPLPIEKIASGGELSRLMLALKIIEKKKNSLTYIFDEVDSGVGGKTAEKVGEKLKEISKNHQTIVITHFPQVAAVADSHFKVEKYERDGRTEVSVKKLSQKERVEEIARMMAGSKVSEHTIRSAEELVGK